MEITIAREYAYFSIICVVVGILISIFASILFMSKRIGMWKLFEKAGEREWKSIVPIYNQIVLLKMLVLGI